MYQILQVSHGLESISLMNCLVLLHTQVMPPSLGQLETFNIKTEHLLVKFAELP